MSMNIDTRKSTTDANQRLALSLLEIAREMEKGDKADVSWLLFCSGTLYDAATALAAPTTN